MVSTKCMTNQKVGNKKFWENRAFGIYEKQRKAQIRIACFYGFTGWSFAKDDILWLHNLFIVKLQTQSEGLGVDFTFAMEQEQQEQEPHPNFQDGMVLEV